MLRVSLRQKEPSGGQQKREECEAAEEVGEEVGGQAHCPAYSRLSHITCGRPGRRVAVIMVAVCRRIWKPAQLVEVNNGTS